VIVHIIVLIFVKKESGLHLLDEFKKNDNIFKRLKIDRIELIDHKDLETIRQAGIKGGKKNLNAPDLRPPLTTANPLDFKNLGIDQRQQAKVANPPQINESPVKNSNNITSKPITDQSELSNIYFNYKKQKVIPPSREHEIIKSETTKNLGIDKINSKASNISNFDIRIERPEGVSEDQLNADEKAFYSFYKRTYTNYISKLFSTFNKVRIDKPGLDQDFNDQHLLIGKIDYDENGDIVTIKIIKSSSSDDVHYFFEEVLKNLKIPNPPKIFVKKQKQFSIYYQIHIN
jgi:hypothetical protein